MKEPIWLRKDVVLAFHEMTLAEHGGLSGLRDEGLLESALGRPINQYFYESADLYRLGAAYASGICKNHPFIDGNKRTAFISMKTFMTRNGIWLKVPKIEGVTVFLSLASADITEEELAQWIKKISKH